MLADDHEEFQSVPGQATRISDPYPLMAEKAGRVYSPMLGRILRLSSIGDALKFTLSRLLINLFYL